MVIIMDSEYSTGDLMAAILDFRDAVESKFATTDAKIDGLGRDVAVMKSDITVLKYDVGVLKDDVGVLKDDVGVLKDDVRVLKDDVRVLKDDVRVLKDDMSDVRAWTKRTDIRLDRLEDRRGRKR